MVSLHSQVGRRFVRFARMLLGGLLFALTAFSAPLTFSDVAPLISARCVSCHRSAGSAPMALGSYQEVQPWIRQIRDAVISRGMPPWPSDPEASKPFANDRSLSDDEINLLIRWIDEGASPGESPPIINPPASQGWALGEPDVVYTGEEFVLPEVGELPYTYFVISDAFPKDTWVRSAEIRTKAGGAVHHIVVYARPPKSSYLSGAPERRYFVPARTTRDRIQGAENPFEWRELLAVYAPGTNPLPSPEGAARLIKAGSDLVFELHYTPDGIHRSDHPEIGLRIEPRVPARRLLTASAANANFVIPPGAPDTQVNAQLAFRQKVRLHSLMPHMHLRGKSFQYWIRYPTGVTESLRACPVSS